MHVCRKKHPFKNNLLIPLKDVLPFFDSDAIEGSDAWPSIYNATTWFTSHTNHTKKIIFTQTGTYKLCLNYENLTVCRMAFNQQNLVCQ